jgi:hypothetical protein
MGFEALFGFELEGMVLRSGIVSKILGSRRYSRLDGWGWGGRIGIVRSALPDGAPEPSNARSRAV